jgi:signal peptidase I
VVPVEQLDPDEVLCDPSVWISGSVGGAHLPEGGALELIHHPRGRASRAIALPADKGRFATTLLVRNGANDFELKIKNGTGDTVYSQSFTLFYKSSFREWNETIFIAFFLALIIRSLVLQAFWIPTGSMEPTLLGEKRDPLSLELKRSGDRILVNRYAYVADFSLDGRISRVLAFFLSLVPPSPDAIPPLKPEKDIGEALPVLTPEQRYRFALEQRIQNALRLWFAFPQRGDIVVFKFPDRNPLNPSRDFIKRVVGLPGDTIRITDGIVTINGTPLVEPYIAEPPLQDFATTVPPDSLFVMGDNRNNSADSRYWGPMPMANLKGQAIFLYWPLGRLHPIRSFTHTELP